MFQRMLQASLWLKWQDQIEGAKATNAFRPALEVVTCHQGTQFPIYDLDWMTDQNDMADFHVEMKI